MREQDAIPLSFGLWLREQRNALDLRQKDLAQHIGCSIVAVAKFEAGQRRPSTQIAERLAEYFNVPAQERSAFIRFARGKPDAPTTQATQETLPLARAPIQTVQTNPRAPWRNVNSPEYLTSYPNNLPVQPTSFVGRESQTFTGCNLLMRQSVHLLTLTGPPGIGKTRLALHIATHLLDVFRDGVYFVSLSHVNTREHALNQIAHALSISEDNSADLIENIKKYLRAKHILLVLDNYEQLLPSAVAPATLMPTELLKAAAGLKILVTSRARLHLYGEHELEVPTMSIPNPTETKKIVVQRAEEYEAVQLFVERARAAKADFSLSSDNVRAVAGICVSLEGLPLAIELAAVRVKFLSAQQMLKQLEGRQYLSMLSKGPQDVPARHRTVSSAIAWSYDLLNTREQALFRSLSVFAGSFTLEAAREVAGHYQSPTDERSNAPTFATGALEADLLEEITSLVDKSLLSTEGSLRERPNAELAKDERRYSMLHVIKEYGLKELEKSGELQDIRDKHAHYYLQLAQRVEGELRGPGSDEWLKVIENEHENMLAALRTLEENGTVEIALHLLAVLGLFWFRRARFISQGRMHVKRVLLASSRQALSQAKSAEFIRREGIESIDGTQGAEQQWRGIVEVRAKVLHWAASLAWRQDDMGTARLFNEESVAISRELGDKTLLARTLNLSGILALEDCNYDAGRSVLEECLKITSELDSPERGLRCTILNNLGEIAWHQGDYDAARFILESSVAESLKSGSKPHRIHALNSLSRVLVHQGDYEGAHAHLQRALELSSEIDYTYGRSLLLNKLGLLRLKQGDYAGAERFFEESLIIASEFGSEFRGSWCLIGLSAVAIAIRQGPRSEAIRIVRMLGKVDTIWNAYQGSISVADRQDYQDLVAASRNLLDEVLWEKGWSEGQALSIDQAVSLALQKPQQQFAETPEV